jgi:hypothetical protein
MPGVIQTLRVELDKASARDLTAALGDMATQAAATVTDALSQVGGNEVGRKAGAELVAGLSAAFQADLDALRLQFERGIIDAKTFEAKGVEAARKFNDGLRGAIGQFAEEFGAEANPFREMHQNVQDAIAEVAKAGPAMADEADAAGAIFEDALSRRMGAAGEAGAAEVERGMEETDLAPAGKAAGDTFLDELRLTTRTREAEIREAQIRGFITDDEAARRGRDVAIAHNAALLAEMNRLRASGAKIPPEMFLALVENLKTIRTEAPRAAREVNLLGGAATTLGRALSRLMAPIAAFFTVRSLARFAVSSIQEYGREESALDSLRAQVEATGASYQNFAPRIDAIRDRFTETGRASGGQFNRVLADMVAVSGNAEKSLRNMGVAADFAAKHNITLEKSGELVGRAMIGQTRGLNLYGVAVKKGEDAVLAMARSSAGFFDKQTPGWTRATTLLSNAWSDLKAEIGAALVEAGGGTSTIDTLIGVIRGATRWVKENHGTIREWGQALMTVLGWLAKDGVNSLNSFTDFVRSTRRELAWFSTQWKEAGGIVKMAGGLIVSAFAAIVAGWAEFTSMFGRRNIGADMLARDLKNTANDLVTEGVAAINGARERWEREKAATDSRFARVRSGSSSTAPGVGGAAGGSSDEGVGGATTGAGMGGGEGSGRDALQDRIALLARAAQFSGTAAEATTELRRIEGLLEIQVARGTGTLKERLAVAEKLKAVQDALAGGLAGGFPDDLPVDFIRQALPPLRTIAPPEGPTPQEIREREESPVQRILREAGERGPREVEPFGEDFADAFLGEGIEDWTRNASQGIVDTFETTFADVLSGAQSVDQALGSLGKGMARSILKEIAAMAKGKAIENVAHAIEETARGFAALASFNPAAASMHFKAAGGFALAAVKWGLVAGGAGTLANAAGGGGGGAGGAGRGEGSNDLSGDRSRATIVIRGGLLDTSNSEQMDALAAAIREVSERDVVIQGR